MKIFKLLENRIDFIRNNLSSNIQQRITSNADNLTVDEVINKANSVDPSNNKKYTQWIVRQYVNGNLKYEDFYKLTGDLSKFETIKSQLEKKDINQYTPKSLLDVITKHSPQQSKRQEKQQIKTEGAEVVAKGPDCTIVKLLTQAAACYYGRQTRWCTAATGSENMFDEYNDDAPLYVVLTAAGRKYQLHFGSEEIQAMNERDEAVDLSELMDELGTLKKWIKKHIEPELMKNPSIAVNYAVDVIKGRWPEAEPYIMKSPYGTLEYVQRVIKGRWHEGEPHIMKNPDVAFLYASYVIKGRWPEAEPYIMKDPEIAFKYAKNIIKGRWPEAESSIKKDQFVWSQYSGDFLS